MLRWIEHSLSFISRMALTHVEIDLEFGIPALPLLRLVLQSASVRGPIRKRRGRDRQRARRQQRHPRVVQLQGLLILQFTIHFILIHSQRSVRNTHSKWTLLLERYFIYLQILCFPLFVVGESVLP